MMETAKMLKYMQRNPCAFVSPLSDSLFDFHDYPKFFSDVFSFQTFQLGVKNNQILSSRLKKLKKKLILIILEHFREFFTFEKKKKKKQKFAKSAEITTESFFEDDVGVWE